MMNEKKIQELAEQAFCDTALYGGSRGDKYFDQRYNENFAELIVRECMLICGAIQGAGELRNMHEFASGAAQCKGIIKRDFGVEE